MTVEDGPGDTLNVSESVDSDELNNKDGDDVVDPPENWKGSDRFGTTLREEGEGEPLDERLAEEEPDVNADFAGDAAGASEAIADDLDRDESLVDDTKDA